MKKIINIIYLIIITAGIVSAEGSIYTRYGLGDFYSAISARRVGLGGMGIALADQHYLGTFNPAGWNELLLTRFETGFSMRHSSVEDKNSSASFNDFAFSGFAVGLPVQKNYGIAIVGGLIPVSDVSYNISYVHSDDLVDDYTITYNGSGGLSKLFIGASYRLPFGVSIGASYEYYTGKIDYDSQVLFESGSSFDQATYRKNNQYRGIGFNFGVISNNLSEYFGESIVSDIRIAFTFNKVSDLNTDTTLVANSSLGTANLSHDLVKTKIPDKIGVGAKITFDSDYTLLLDFITQDWNDYRLAGHKINELTSYSKYGLGFEYHKSDVSLRTSALEQMAFRGGLSYETGYYLINDEDISQFSIHAGFSYPLEFGNTIDIGLKYSIRGKTDNNLIKENILKVYFSMSIGELWFVRQEK